MRAWGVLPPAKPDAAAQAWDRRFWAAALADLNLPAALGILWAMLRHSKLGPDQKRDLLLGWDRLLGLGLDAVEPEAVQTLPEDVRHRLRRRERARAARDFATADALRAEIRAIGYALRDTPSGTIVRPQPPEQPQRYSRAADAPSLLSEADRFDVSVCLLVHDYREDVQRCIASLVANEGGHRVEYVIVENASTDGTAAWLEQLASANPHVRLLRADHRLGEAEGRNLALRQATGRVVLLLDTGVEATGDVFGPILAALDDPATGAVGRWGLRSADMRHFENSEEREVDAIAGYLFAFRRRDLARVGWMDPKYRYYRNLDLHFGFQFRDLGMRLIRRADIPARMHEHRGWEELSEAERDKRSKRNFYRFLNAWHHREDLLITNQ
jgi:cysteinyl-tRNA synthetase